jgi:hypothetical protein
VTEPDLSLLDDVVAPRVLAALRSSSAELTRLGVRHVVIGGLAVGANGHPRNTKDVVFLVGDEAFVKSEAGLVSLAPGVPFQAGGVAIDLLAPEPDEAHLAAVLDGAFGTPIDAPRLIYMKLKANRMQDQADVVNLIKAGIDRDATRSYLETHASDLVGLFDRYLKQAALEESG